MTILPFFIIVLVIIFWKIKKENIVIKNSKSILCILIIIDIIHPSIINATIETLTCTHIDSEWHLRKDLYYLCYQSAHFYKVYIFMNKK